MSRVRSFNRLVTQRIGALNDHYLSRSRPLGEARVLWEIGTDGCDVRRLRSRLGLDAGYLSRILRALERDALIEVVPSEHDRRVRRVRLTPAGRKERDLLDRRSDELAVSFLEPLSALAVAAGVTERVRLGTSILIMPLRNPVLLAKELATLQFLSENRMILGAGVGWNDAEYEAVGVKKSERGKRTDEILDIMLPLLEGDTVSYHGHFFSVDDVFI